MAERTPRRLDGEGNSFERQFAALRRDYMAEIPARIAAMLATAESLAAGGWDVELVKALHVDIHKLAGSSSLYRMPQLNSTAAVLEQIVKLLLKTPPWPPPSSPRELVNLVKAVRRAANDEIRQSDPGRPKAPRRVKEQPTTVIDSGIPEPPAKRESSGRRSSRSGT